MNKSELETQILEAQKAYYEDSNPLLTDKEFDDLYEELKERFPESEILNSVGDDTKDGFIKRPHLMTMGSQEKFNTSEGLLRWVNLKKVEFPVIVEHKLDGLSIELQYKNGDLQHAVTRGNGAIGDDITKNVRKMQGVNGIFPGNFTGSLRGEILMKRNLFNEKYKPQGFANPRNLASGIAKSKEGKNCSDLTILFYDAVSSHYLFKTELDILDFLSRIQVQVVPFVVTESVQEILTYRNEIRDFFSLYEFDGLVLKQNKKVGEDLYKLRPDYQRAFKWNDEGKETFVKNVIWNRSGVTYTPVAELESIEIEGSIVSRASLANPNLIKNLDLSIGDKVFVTKRGQIIPKIEKVVEKPENRKEIQIPTYCKVCNSELINEGSRLYCNNPLCEGKKEHQIAKWISTLEVKGFGSVLLRTMYNLGIVSIPDLYSAYTEWKVTDSTNLKEATRKSFKNLYSVKSITLSQLIAGFDIEGIGRRLIEEVEKSGINTLDKILNSSIDNFSNVPGFSRIRAQNLVKGLRAFENDIRYISNILDIKQSTDSTQVSDKDLGTFCITGKLEMGTRKDLVKIIEDNGGKSVSGVNKNTDYLIINDQSSTSSKAKKARELGIKMISEKDFFDMI